MMASPAARDERWVNPPLEPSDLGPSVLSPSGYVKLLVAVFLAAIVIRGCVAFASLERFGDDPDAYRAIAQTLIRHGVYGLTGADDAPFATAFRPPLYPYVLSWTSTSSVGLAVLHTILGALTVVMMFAATFTILESWRVASLASALVAIDPILLQQSTLVMTETLACAIVAALLWRWNLAARGGFKGGESLQIGILLSAAYLCRPTFLVWTVMLIFGLIVMRRGWRPALLVTSIVAITVAAWTIRNVRELGHPVWATTHGGYTLLLANNPMFYDHLRQSSHGTVWDPQTFLDAYSHRYDDDPTTPTFWQRDWTNAPPPVYPDDEGEIDDDRLTSAAAKATITREPKMFAYSSLVRVSRLWSPFPLVTSERSRATTFGIGAYYVVLYAMVFVGAIKLFRHPTLGSRWAWWPAVAMVLTLSAVHAIYWSNLRMRAPAVPVFAMVAAACCYRPRVNEVALSTKEFGDDVAND